ncbi:hypothetical protein [Flavobacterium sp.]|uniref:hypothetical protein n=1 Tax=Flavobacterium sp. TaxID=239 RepID=UPI0037BF0262
MQQKSEYKVTVFHTQEKRIKIMTFPQPCTRDDAWLGEGYYFWKDETDAFDWGHNSKKRNGYFEVYTCDINSDNYLDTVFNEKHYNFWIAQLEKIAKKIAKKIMVKTHEKPTLKELNDYIRDKAIWPQVEYIQFQDLPTNSERSLVKPIVYKQGKIRTVAFRKRIQICVYNPKIISNFALNDTVKVI